MKKMFSILFSVIMLITSCLVVPITAMANPNDSYAEKSGHSYYYWGNSTGVVTSGDYEYYPYYSADSRYITIYQYKGNASVVNIPEKIDGKIVKAIGWLAFQCLGNLKEVTIPNTVETIATEAFYQCTALEKVNFGTGLKVIGNDAFISNKKLKSVTLPESVECIGDYAFSDCTSLSQIKLGSKIKYFGCNAFKNTAYYNNNKNWQDGALYVGKYLVAGYNVKGSYTVKKGTIGIAEYAMRCGTAKEPRMTSLTVPDSVKYIGSHALSGCTKCKTIKLGNGLEYIGFTAFNDTPFYKNNKKNGALYIGKYLIQYTGKAKSYTVKKGTKLIAERAFKSREFTKVTLPDSIRIINDEAFIWCNMLTEINFPEGLKTLGDGAFDSCVSLKKVKLPKSLRRMGTDTFQKCLGVESYSVHKDNPSYSSAKGVLFNKKKTVLIAYPMANTAASYTLPSTVKRICPCAFYNAKKLQTVTLNDGLQYIERNAFLNCTGITQMVVPDSVIAMDWGAIGFFTRFEGEEDFEMDDIYDKFTAYGHKETLLEQYCAIDFDDGQTTIGNVRFKELCSEHRFQAVKEKKPTYFAKGYTAYKVCENCGLKEGYLRTDKKKLAAPKVSYKAGKGQLKVTYHKVKDATGFQVKYTKGKKSYTKEFKTNKTVTKTIKKLSKGKWKVKVRAYVEKDGAKAYGTWSSTKTVNVK